MAKKIRQIGGGMGFFDELELDLEEPLREATSLVSEAPSAIAEAASDLFKDILGGEEPKEEKKFESTGEISDFQTKNKEKEEKEKLQQQLNLTRTQLVTAEEMLFDQQQKLKSQREFARLVESALTADEKNNLLHLSVDYAEKNTDDPYHLVNLRKKLKEKIDEDLKAKEAQEVEEVHATQKGGINLNKVAEGGQQQLSTTGGGGIG